MPCSDRSAEVRPRTRPTCSTAVSGALREYTERADSPPLPAFEGWICLKDLLHAAKVSSTCGVPAAGILTAERLELRLLHDSHGLKHLLASQSQHLTLRACSKLVSFLQESGLAESWASLRHSWPCLYAEAKGRSGACFRLLRFPSCRRRGQNTPSVWTGANEGEPSFITLWSASLSHLNVRRGSLGPRRGHRSVHVPTRGLFQGLGFHQAGCAEVPLVTSTSKSAVTASHVSQQSPTGEVRDVGAAEQARVRTRRSTHSS